jgi:uncharacterized Zn finger protein
MGRIGCLGGLKQMEVEKVADAKARYRKIDEEMNRLKKPIFPVIQAGRTMAKKFWGKAWCKHLEFAYRHEADCLRRGRRYVRQGAVLELEVTAGKMIALVKASLTYPVEIVVSKVTDAQWDSIVNACEGKIDSLAAILRGELSKAVKEILIGFEKGLLPRPEEIQFYCACSGGKKLCEHVSAVLYGAGIRFDEYAEYLFILRWANFFRLSASL